MNQQKKVGGRLVICQMSVAPTQLLVKTKPAVLIVGFPFQFICFQVITSISLCRVCVTAICLVQLRKSFTSFLGFFSTAINFSRRSDFAGKNS